jgi:hypothetical protein
VDHFLVVWPSSVSNKNTLCPSEKAIILCGEFVVAPNVQDHMLLILVIVEKDLPVSWPLD